MSEIERVYVEDASSHRWHEALREGNSEPRLYDACNVEGERVYHDRLPPDLPAELLCKRCFG